MTCPAAAFLLALACASVSACSEDEPASPGVPPVGQDTTVVSYTYEIVDEYPHDTGAFTEGLVWDDSVLIESTGYVYPESSVRRVDLATGVVQLKRASPLKNGFPVFGEGLARVDDRVVQLTWTDRIAWIYDAQTFDSLGYYTYDTEGWGLTHDGARFIMSDGSSTLYFRDLDTFAETGRVTVRDENGPVVNLNELEYIQGRVFANVFLTNLIVMIDPATGRVRGRANMSGIIANPPEVMNGIAWDAAGDRCFVTGKYWPKLFEVRFVPVTP
jgi:glutamine cyclotransferase